MGIPMRQAQQGVTLIELMAVMLIIGLLAAIAYPSYRQQVIRSNRTEAKASLMQAAQGLEKCFTRFGSYNDAGCAITARLVSPEGITSGEGLYRVWGQIDAAAFTLRAVPQQGQTSDVACGTLTLTQSGLRGVQGTSDAQTCW
jgi:type IV pilus assembly protein PilE